MKKILLLLLPIYLLAESFLISNIPIPKTYIQNLDPYPCDEKCLQEYLDNGMVFSFLAHVDSKLENQELDDIRMMSVSILNLGSNVVCDKIKIALLLPYKIIGKYAASTTNASFAYLIAKNRSFELKSYKINSENYEDLQNTFFQIQNDGFNYVIAPLTKNGAFTVSQIDPQINVFFPTINKKDVNSTSEYLYFGGIDYRAQNDILLTESVSPLVILYDQSSLGKTLAQYQEQKFLQMDLLNQSLENMGEKKVVKFLIPKRTTNLERQLKDNENIQHGSFFLNTPIVKSGMIMSQLTLYDANATNLLSTQINYDPLLFSMTQYRDRKEMIIANSITSENNILIETNALLGNDIVYDWINYTTTVGIDYFFHLLTKEDREYDIEIRNRQMLYPIELLQPSKSKFINYQRVIEASPL